MAATKMYHSILDEIEILERFPKIAPVESLLINQSKTFRSLLVAKGLFKIIYFLESETIYITHYLVLSPKPSKPTNKTLIFYIKTI